jgi:ankyrin repeat protein
MMDMPRSKAALLFLLLLISCSDKAATQQSLPTKPKTWACSFDQPAHTITTAELKTTPLHDAVYDLHEGMAARLLKTVSANVRDGIGQTPIFGVVRGPIPEPKDMARDPVLYQQKNIKDAAARLRMTKLLIAAHADVDVQDNAGTTPLMHGLVGYGRVEPYRTQTLQILIAASAKPDMQDRDGYTALMQAVVIGDIQTARLLRAKGANSLITSCNGKSAIDLAREAKLPELIKLLVK